jgi:hypothetical protein
MKIPDLRDATDLAAKPVDELLARMQAEKDVFFGKPARWRMA